MIRPNHEASPPDLDSEAARRARTVRLVALDVDGVLTDGRLIVSADGGEAKQFHVRDGLGIVLAREAGIEVAFVSGRSSTAVARRARELGIPETFQVAGCRDKGAAMRELRGRASLSIEQIAFVGDDLNDLPAFSEAGFRVAVADSARELVDAADHVTGCPGGRGAVRETLEAILRAQGRWPAAIEAYLNALRRPDPHSPQ